MSEITTQMNLALKPASAIHPNGYSLKPASVNHSTGVELNESVACIICSSDFAPSNAENGTIQICPSCEKTIDDDSENANNVSYLVRFHYACLHICLLLDHCGKHRFIQ